MSDRRARLLGLIASMDQQLREVEQLAATAPDDDTLQKASAMLIELREAMQRTDSLLQIGD